MSEKGFSPMELLHRLEAEHDEHYVYRGESRLFPPPMWPSSYRRFFASEGDVRIDQRETIRGSGNRFFFRLDFMRDPYRGQDQRAYEALMKNENIRLICKSHIRNALGYPLAEAMFQQAGWSSEGIDVSYDPKVALTFALSKWEDGRGQLWARSDPAVLYRFRVGRRQWGLGDLRKYGWTTRFAAGVCDS